MKLHVHNLYHSTRIIISLSVKLLFNSDSVEVPMKLIFFFLLLSVAYYVYFSGLLEANNVTKRKIQLFAAQSELSIAKQWVRSLATSLQAMT